MWLVRAWGHTGNARPYLAIAAKQEDQHGLGHGFGDTDAINAITRGYHAAFRRSSCNSAQRKHRAIIVRLALFSLEPAMGDW